MVQDLLYGRFRDRLLEVGAYGELEAIHEYWQGQKAQQAATQTETNTNAGK